MTTFRAWVFLLSGVFLSAAGTLMMRAGGRQADFPKSVGSLLAHGKLWLFGIFLGWIAGLGYSLALTKIPAVRAAGFYIPSLYMLIMLGGVFILGEKISMYGKFGIFLIFSGLILCAFK